MHHTHFTMIRTITSEHWNDLLALYKNEWWCCERTLEDVQVILANSSMTFGLIDNQTQRLIGFSRVLTDYFRFAYIYDVIIHPDFRGQDLGKYLIQTIVDIPEIKQLHSVELVCRKDKVSFYEQFGFSHDYGLSVAMRRLKTNA